MKKEQKRERSRMRERRNRLNILVVALAAVFCMAVVAGAGYFVYASSQSVEASIPRLQAEGKVKTGTLNDPEGRQRELDAIVEEGMVAFSINATPYIQDGKGKANFMIENPPGNGNRFTVSISRDDTGEEIYRSGYIEPEQYIDEAPLDVELPKGEYACTASFDTYRLSEDTYIGRAAAKITLYVLE